MTIDNMLFTGTAIAAPPAPRPNEIKKAAQFPSAADDTQPSANTPESITTDNIYTNAHNESINQPPQDFSHTLRKTATTEPPQQDQDNTKPEKQNSAPAIPSKANPTQSLPIPEIPTTLGSLVKEVATQMEPKSEPQLAQLLANLKDGKSMPVTGHAAKSAEIKLLATTDKGQLGLKTVLPENSKGQTGLKTTLPETSNGQPVLQAALSNTSKGTPTADTQAGQGENTDKILISNGTVVPTKAPINGENIKELMPDDLVDADSKATTTDEEAATTDKPATPINQKTPALNTNFPPAQAKSPEVQSQPVGIAPEKTTPIDEQTSDSNAATPKILSESSTSSNGKESPHAGNKLSDDPVVQEGPRLAGTQLNVTEVQVSTGQTKEHGSSNYNNSFNSDLEQILSHNNPQTPVTEQSPTSSEGIKTAELPAQTSPSDVSADVGKQILESIQSSLSQQRENQQITVHLNPPELGKVFIKFQEQDAQIIGLLEVSKPQTRIEIQQALPQIIQNLQDSGIQVKRVEVVLSEADQPEQEALKDSASGGPQNGWTQEQDTTNPDTQTNNPYTRGINEWLLNNNSYQNISELQETLFTDGINMLA